jgi:D-beta-D-heptose 7-phosphate kinase/D-beta-D-heptose 1-phosphate adenosyltransferase
MKIAPSRLNTIVRKISGTRVLVVGDVMLDHFIWGTVRRISPEAPVPVVEVSSESRMPGGAANVAVNLRALGAKTAMVGITGRDENGLVLKRLLTERGIETRGLLSLESVATTKKSRVIAHHQQVVRVDRDRPPSLSPRDTESLLRKIRRRIPGCGAVILEDYGKGTLTQEVVDEVKTMCRKFGVISALDPKLGHELDLDGIDLCTPNLEEARSLGRDFPKPSHDLPARGEALRKALGLVSLLITLGEDGMALFSRDCPPYRIPTHAREVFDVSGAGDTVISVFTAALAAGGKANEAAFLANLAAGIVVAKLGTAAVTPRELRRELGAVKA